MKSKRSSIIKIVIFALLTCMTLYYVKILWVKSEKVEVVSQSDFDLVNDGNVGKISRDVTITQTFTADKDFSGVVLYVATYSRVSYSTMHLQLLDAETGEKITEKDFSSIPIQDNSKYAFVFDDIIEVNGKHQYEVVVTTNAGKVGNAITLWSTSTDDYAGGTLSINNEEQNNDLVFQIVYKADETRDLGMFLHRLSLIVLIFIFVGLHFFVNIRKMYEWIFQKRVWCAIAVFIFLVANKYNFSSVSQFDAYVETGEGSQYVYPVFGKARSIRSDEWMVSLPRLMSAEYSDYGKYNNIVRGTETTNLSASGLYRSYGALAQPANWGFYLFGSEYGESFLWCFNMVFGFLFTFEFCLIVTKKQRLLSFLGANLIWFSAYNMWWSTVNWLLMGQATLVLAYYFLKEIKTIRRFGWGCGIAIFGSAFVVNLYPAWQVPAGYFFLMILIWMFADNWKNIRSYKWYDWLCVVGTFVLMGSIILVYFKNDAEYLTAITNTVYPGSRICYGGYSITRLFGYIGNLLMPVVEYGNPSEAGRFVTLFPIPLILAVYAFFKNSKKDLLTGLLLIPTIVLGIYCVIEMPATIAKILLLTYTTPERAADILGYAMVLLLVVVLGRYGDKARLKLPYAVIVTAVVMGITLYYTKVQYAGYAKYFAFVIIGIAIAVVFTMIIAKIGEQWHKRAIITASIVVLITGLMVNPLSYGLDAITSKPVAKEIGEIVSEDADGIWIAVGSAVSGNFMVACGAPTLNSVNYIPNMDMWAQLNLGKSEEELYNRYAHIAISLIDDETYISLRQADYIDLYLSYDDLQRLNISYIYTNDKLTNKDNITFEKLYGNNNTYIYRVTYKE